MATYYVKNGGSNASDGLSHATAWETLAYAESNSTSNDTILLRRGDTFRQTQLFTLATGQTWGAYGSGDRPKVYGSIPASDLTWASEGGGVYSTTDAEIQGWAGALTRGIWEPLPSRVGYANCDTLTRCQNNQGSFFFDDDVTDTLYVRTTDDSEPSAQEIALWNCFWVDTANVTIRDLHFLYGTTCATQPGADNLLMQDCTVEHQAYYGMECTKLINSTIRRVDFNYNGQNRGGAAITLTGTSGNPSNNNVIEYCTASYNGGNVILNPLGESHAWGGGFAFENYSTNNICRFSSVIGYSTDNEIASDLLLTVEGGAGVDGNTFAYCTASNGIVLMNASSGTTNTAFHNCSVYGLIQTSDTGNNAMACAQVWGDDVDIKNCILSRGFRSLSGVARHVIVNSGSGGTPDWDYNIYYDDGAGYSFDWKTTVETSLADWKTTSSLDANSTAENPLFGRPTNNDLRIRPGSPALAAGTTLGGTQVVNDMSETDTQGQTFRYTSATTHVTLYFTNTAGAIDIDGVRLKLQKFGSPTGNMHVEMWTDSTGDPGSQTGSDSDTLDVSTVSTSATTYDFTFPSSISLSNSTAYHIVVQGTYTISTSNNVRIRVDDLVTDDDATKGIKESSDFSTWTDRPEREPYIQLLATTSDYTSDLAQESVSQSTPSIGAYENWFLGFIGVTVNYANDIA